MSEWAYVFYGLLSTMALFCFLCLIFSFINELTAGDDDHEDEKEDRKT